MHQKEFYYCGIRYGLHLIKMSVQTRHSQQVHFQQWTRYNKMKLFSRRR